ncbi:unnamed protein product [Schistosoma turkestanicum]|nr:unnamed protein product [Schistosoma turkestanicum]
MYLYHLNLKVFVWGFGCIGLGPKVTYSPRPTLIPPGLFIPAIVNSESCINYVVAGLHHFIAQSNDGLLWAWGAPRGGLYCLGLGKQITNNADNSQTYPTSLLLPIKSKDVVCGVDHTVVIGKSFVFNSQIIVKILSSNRRILFRPQFRQLCQIRSISSFPLDKYNAYDVLGVKQSATSREIKFAYYNLSKCLHPDRLLHTNPEKLKNKEFHLITAAYELLRDQKTRSQYDQYLASSCWIQPNRTNNLTNFDDEFQRARTLYARNQKFNRYKSYRYGPDQVVEEFRSRINTNDHPEKTSNYYACRPQPPTHCPLFLLTIVFSTFLLYFIMKCN